MTPRGIKKSDTTLTVVKKLIRQEVAKATKAFSTDRAVIKRVADYNFSFFGSRAGDAGGSAIGLGQQIGAFGIPFYSYGSDGTEQAGNASAVAGRGGVLLVPGADGVLRVLGDVTGDPTFWMEL